MTSRRSLDEIVAENVGAMTVRMSKLKSSVPINAVHLLQPSLAYRLHSRVPPGQC